MPEFPSFLRLAYIPLYVYTTFCLSIDLLMDIWVASTFWLLWIMLLWTWVNKSLFKTLLSILLDVYPEVELLGHMIIWSIFIFWEMRLSFFNRHNSFEIHLSCVNSSFLCMNLLKRLFFFHWIVFAPLSKILGIFELTKFWVLYSVPSICLSIPLLIWHCLDNNVTYKA